MITQEELGRRIQTARQDAAMSQEELGVVIGVDRSAMSRIEAGQRKVESIELAQLADALGRPLSWFLEDRTEADVIMMRAETGGSPAVRDAVATARHLISDLKWLEGLIEE